MLLVASVVLVLPACGGGGLRIVSADPQLGISIERKHPTAVTVQMLRFDGAPSQNQRAVELSLTANGVFSQIALDAPIKLHITTSSITPTAEAGMFTMVMQMTAKWAVTGPDGFSDQTIVVGKGSSSGEGLTWSIDKAAAKATSEDMIRKGVIWLSQLDLPGDAPTASTKSLISKPSTSDK